MSTYIKAYVPLIVAPFTGESGNPKTFFAARSRPLLDRYFAWLKRRRTERALNALSPRMQRDIGYDPADAEPGPEPIFSSLFHWKR